MSKGWFAPSLSEQEQARFGITTGTCLSAAASASLIYELTGNTAESVKILNPEQASIVVEVQKSSAVLDCTYFEVIKDSGEDPDITNECVVRAACRINDDTSLKSEPHMRLTLSSGIIVNLIAKSGIGLVTRAGLKVKPGQPAINPGPQQMLKESFESILSDINRQDIQNINVYIIIEKGEELAKQTFNPRLGITKGLSILGTTGFVRPMSNEAWVDAIKEELHVAQAFSEAVLLSFGASSEKAAQACLQIDARHCVQMSNFVGKIFDEAVLKGSKHIIIAGQAGKLIKLAGGIMNTHSRESDAKKEMLIAHLACKGVSQDILLKINAANTMSERLDIVRENKLEDVWVELSNNIAQLMTMRAKRLYKKDLAVAVLFIDSNLKPLASSDNLSELVRSFTRDE